MKGFHTLMFNFSCVFLCIKIPSKNLIIFLSLINLFLHFAIAVTRWLYSCVLHVFWQFLNWVPRVMFLFTSRNIHSMKRGLFKKLDFYPSVSFYIFSFAYNFIHYLFSIVLEQNLFNIICEISNHKLLI